MLIFLFFQLYSFTFLLTQISKFVELQLTDIFIKLLLILVEFIKYASL